MSNEFDLMAEFDNGQIKDQDSVEIDLNGVHSFEEAKTEAAESMEVGVDEIEFIGVNAYSTNTNLQALADNVEWGDILTDKDGMDTIEDFLALDLHDQIVSIHLSNFHGISLRDGMNDLDNSFVQIFGNENDIVNDWIELYEVPERVIWYLDKELILEDVYPNREALANGDIIVVSM